MTPGQPGARYWVGSGWEGKEQRAFQEQRWLHLRVLLRRCGGQTALLPVPLLSQRALYIFFLYIVLALVQFVKGPYS